MMSLAEDPNLEGLYPFLHGKKQDPSVDEFRLARVRAHKKQLIITR